MKLTLEDIKALVGTTLMGFEDELTRQNRDFIADQIARKIQMAEREARKADATTLTIRAEKA